jgi:toxin-antitoxin system PIN domain toxin
LSRPSLLDVNVLIALAWPNHTHHRQALLWFKSNRDSGWATCPHTQSAFVRVSSNQRIVPEARSPRIAIEALARLIEGSGHRFLEDDVSIVSAKEFSRDKLTGHNQIADAHLLALAIRRGHLLATFDSGIRELLETGMDQSWIVLIPRVGQPA